MLRYFAILGVILLAISLLSAQWDMVDMGACEEWHWMRPVVVGSAKPDGTNSIFAASFDRNLYEFFYTDSGWVKNVVATFSHNVQRMCIGNGRNAIYNYLYVACGDTHVYEFIWNPVGLCWDSNRIRTPYHANWGVAVGYGRNDGINRLYVACYDNHIYEFTWDGADWDMVDVGTSDTTYGEPFYDIALGCGKNDDTIRVYASSQNDYASYGVWQFTWNGAEWVREPVGNIADGYDIFTITVGDGRNDGITRIYAGGNNGTIAEFTWNGTGWDRTSSPHAGGTKWSIVIGNGRNDEVPHNRVYHACHDGHAYESTWNGSSWDNVDIGVGLGEFDNNMWGIDIGNGRNDAVQRVYVSNYDGHLYEFTFPDAEVVNAVMNPDEFPLSAFPNPFNSSCVIAVNVGDAHMHPASTVEIYDLQGTLRLRSVLGNPVIEPAEIANTHAFIWTPDASIASGIYLVKVRAEDGLMMTKRIVFIR